MVARIPTLLGIAALLISVFAVVRVTTADPGDGTRANTPLGTGFTYQGLVQKDGTPFTGNCDFRFGLFDAAVGVGQLGVTDVSNTNKPVVDGLFSVVINASNQFTAGAFSGSERWLSVEVSCPAGGAFTLLGARQQITPAPYATFAMLAQDSLQLGGFPANQYGRYTRTIIVSPVEGNEVASGAALVAALAGITDASVTKRYLVHVEPGRYSLASTLQMKQFVDFQGSGRESTEIAGTAGAILNGEANMEIRDLELSFVGVGTTAITGAGGGGGTAVRRVNIILQGQAAIQAVLTLVMEDVTISLTCAASPCNGILFSNGGFTARNLTIAVSAGSTTARGIRFQNSGAATIDDSSITVNGGNPGTGNLAALESVSGRTVTLTQSRFNVSNGGAQGTGLLVAGDTTVVSSFVSVTVTGSALNVGINATRTLTVRDSDVSVNSATNNTAIDFHPAGSQLGLIQSSRVVAIATSGIGVQKSGGSGILRIIGTDIESFAAPINGAVGVGGVRVTASQLRSAVAVTGGANVVCAGNTDETTAVFASTCP